MIVPAKEKELIPSQSSHTSWFYLIRRPQTQWIMSKEYEGVLLTLFITFSFLDYVNTSALCDNGSLGIHS